MIIRVGESRKRIPNKYILNDPILWINKFSQLRHLSQRSWGRSNGAISDIREVGISTAAVSSVRNPGRTPSRSLLRSLRPPPAFAGRGDASGLFWNLVSGESAFRNALRCAVHRLVSIPSILRSQSQQLPHLRSLLHWRIEELAIPVLQETVADEYHPRTYSRDIRHRFRRSSPSRSMQSQRRMGEQGVVDETFCCKVGLLAEHSKPRTPLLFGDVVTRELYELIPLSSVEAPCNYPSWGTKKKESQQEHSQ